MGDLRICERALRRHHRNGRRTLLTLTQEIVSLGTCIYPKPQKSQSRWVGACPRSSLEENDMVNGVDDHIVGAISCLLHGGVCELRILENG